MSSQNSAEPTQPTASEVPAESAALPAEAPSDELTDATPMADAPVEDVVAVEPVADTAVAAEPAQETPVEEVPVEEVPAAEEVTAAEEPAVETPAAPRPIPTPGPPRVPSPAAVAAAAAPHPVPLAPVSHPVDGEWGRVAEDGTVEVRDGDSWRTVGEYPDGTPEEALAYFARKYDDLAFTLVTLEQRHAAGGASASELRSQAQRLLKDLDGAAAVGDLASLTERGTRLIDELAAASAEEAAAARAAVDAAIVERTGIVERAEALSAKDPQTVQWKQATAELNELFAAWQHHQQSGPRLPKAQAQALWKRFRDARSLVERHRRSFFAELDETHKSARDVKNRLIARAEALAPQGEAGIPAYRSLLDEWKRAGRAGRKADDALWERFKSAGDALYHARAERDAAEQAESAPRIEARKALIAEAAGIADIADLVAARKALTAIQRRWDEVGRIFPRDVERGLDDQFRRIEQELKGREEVDWKRNNPETKARANSMSDQLREAIEKLEGELAAAQAAGNAKAITEAEEALEARRTWLRAIGG